MDIKSQNGIFPASALETSNLRNKLILRTLPCNRTRLLLWPLLLLRMLSLIIALCLLLLYLALLADLIPRDMLLRLASRSRIRCLWPGIVPPFEAWSTSVVAPVKPPSLP